MNISADRAAEHLRHFDALYATESDPWHLGTTWCERHKRDEIQRALGGRRLASGLELGCGAGITTRQLARSFERLVAVDGSRAATQLARRELSDVRHVKIVEACLPLDMPCGPYDAVIASEILYYLPGCVLQAVIAGVYRALKPGGRLVSVNHVRRFSDSEHTLAQIAAKTRRQFGRPKQSRTSGSWNIEVYRKDGQLRCGP